VIVTARDEPPIAALLGDNEVIAGVLPLLELELPPPQLTDNKDAAIINAGSKNRSNGSELMKLRSLFRRNGCAPINRFSIRELSDSLRNLCTTDSSPKKIAIARLPSGHNGILFPKR
jgi:hypothetical protein